MKSLIAILALAMPCLLISQNTILKTYPTNNSTEVLIEFEYGDISIEKYNGSEIIIEGNVTVNGQEGEKFFEFKSKNEGNTLKIIASADFEDADKRLTIVMNDGSKIYKNGKNLSIDNINKSEGVDAVYNGVDVDANFTMKVPQSMKLRTASTYGNVSVNNYWEGMKLHSTYGSVDVVLDNPPTSPTMEVSSTYSEVDVTIPSTINADLRMKTGYGEIFTDMDFKPDFKNKGENCDFGQDISATLNKGQGAIKLEATYSNIYLRKSKKL